MRTGRVKAEHNANARLGIAIKLEASRVTTKLNPQHSETDLYLVIILAKFTFIITGLHFFPYRRMLKGWFMTFLFNIRFQTVNLT